MVVLSWPDLAARLPSAAPSHRLGAGAGQARSMAAPLFRERHGWCPYSERVWLALEARALSTRRCSSTTRPRPQAVVVLGHDAADPLGRRQNTGRVARPRPRTGRALPGDAAALRDERRGRGDIGVPPLLPAECAAVVARGLPLLVRRAAAALHRRGGARRHRRGVGETGGPSSAATPSAADVAWAPFLERYAAQLPPARRPVPQARGGRARVATAMDGVPARARVQGHPTRGGRCSRCAMAPARRRRHRRRRRPRVGAAGRRRLGRVCGEPAARRADAGGGGGGDDRAQPRRDRRRRREAARGRCGWRPRRRRRAVGWRRRGERRGGGGGAGGAPGRADSVPRDVGLPALELGRWRRSWPSRKYSSARCGQIPGALAPRP